MSDPTNRELASGTSRKASNWGVLLFVGTLALVLIFFWWLLIYSGGVSGHVE